MLYLTVRYSNGKTTYHVLKEPDNWIGTKENCQLRLQEPNVSEYHTRIFYQNQMYWCEDGTPHQPSRTGTWVNGKKVQQAVPLEKQDALLIGTCQIVISDIGKISRSTQEFALAKKQVPDEEFHKTQIAHLNKKIKFQTYKIALATGILLCLIFIGIWTIWVNASTVVVHIVWPKMHKASEINFSTVANANAISLQKAPVSGRIMRIYKLPGNKVPRGEILLQINNVCVLSEIEGYIEEHRDCLWEFGVVVKEGQPLCHIVQTNPIILFLDIDECQCPPWYEGEILNEICFEELANEFFQGSVENITFSAQRAVIVVNILNANNKIRPGMKAKIKYTIYRDGEQGVSIPQACLISNADFPAVYVVQDNRCVLRKVAIKRRTSKELLISRGLEANDMVIISPPLHLKNGQLVKTRN